MNKDLLSQDPNMIERVNRTLFGPVNRLRSNVSIVISPSVEVKGLIDIMRKYKDANATAPIIVSFTDLRQYRIELKMQIYKQIFRKIV